MAIAGQLNFTSLRVYFLCMQMYCRKADDHGRKEVCIKFVIPVSHENYE
jgi:hypothetical protein